MTTIKNLLMPKLYAQGTATLIAKTGDLKVHIDRFLDGSGWRLSVEKIVGKCYDSDYKQEIPIWSITDQFDLKTVDEVIDKIKKLFNIK